jgi:RimJ/RimL family protein N-acetyltransferase
LELEAEQLRLREFVLDDAEFILELLNQPSFIQFIGDKGVRSVNDAKYYIATGPIESYQRHGFGLYLVELRDSKAPIGMCGVLKRESLPEPDLGFAFLPEFWGKGYALEAASAALAQARDVFRLTRILAITSPDNHASIKLLAKLGFQFERVMKLSSDSDEVKLFSLMFETS